jgi:hypothetical protein
VKRLALFHAALSCFAVGTVHQSINQLGDTNNWVVAFNWTGDAITGGVPVTNAAIGQAGLVGYIVTQMQIVPGIPAPTAGYAVSIKDSAGIDMFGGLSTGLSATTSQALAVANSAPPLNGTFSLNLSGNRVAGAKGTVYVFLTKLASAQRVFTGQSSSTQIANRAYVDGINYPLTDAGVQSAVTAICAGGGGQVVIAPNATWATGTTGVTVPCGDITIEGSGNSRAVYVAGSSAITAISIGGSIGSSVLLNSGCNENAVSCTLVAGGVASLGLAVNDYVVVSGTQRSSALGFVSRVTGISGDVVTFLETLPETFTTAGAAAIGKLSPVKRVVVRNLIFDGTLNTNSASHAIASRACIDCIITDNSFIKMGGAGITPTYGHGNTFRRLRMTQCSASIGYADFYPIYETAADISDIESDQAGFGPTFVGVNYSTIRGVRSGSSTARGMKLSSSLRPSNTRSPATPESWLRTVRTTTFSMESMPTDQPAMAAPAIARTARATFNSLGLVIPTTWFMVDRSGCCTSGMPPLTHRITSSRMW